MACVQPVSYTHLDVYKRQVQGVPMGGSRAPPPPPATGRPAPAIPSRPGSEMGQRMPPMPPGRPGGQGGLPPPLIPS